jgi:hypothetical protein
MLFVENLSVKGRSRHVHILQFFLFCSFLFLDFLPVNEFSVGD